MATKNLDLYKLGVVLDAAGAAKGIAALKEADKSATKTYGSLTQLSKSFKFGLAAKFKSEFKEIEKYSGSARSSALGQLLGEKVGQGITGGISSVFNAQTLGSIIGTAIGPGVGTAVGSMIGGAVDTALSKIAGPVLAQIQRGIELNKQLELAQQHFTAFTGSEKEASAHLAELRKLAKDAGLDLPMLLQADQRLEEFNDDVKLSALELRAAADQAARFGSGVDGFNSIAGALGLIAEKGELSSKSLLKLYKQGINAPKILAEGLGLSTEKVKELIAKNRLRGDVAARIIAEGIEKQSGGYAQHVANTTLEGRERQNKALSDDLSVRGTVAITGAQKDLYGVANSLLASTQAGQVVDFLNKEAAGIIGITKSAVSAGYNFTAGVVQGITRGDAQAALKKGLEWLSDSAIGWLKSAWGIHSPSERTANEIGVPISQGIAKGFSEDFQQNTKPRILAQVESLLADPRVRAMLDAIGYSEGTDKKFGYATKVGGGSQGDLAHKDRGIVDLGRGLRSSASGRYQFLNKTWDSVAGQLGLTDFSAHAQDLAAVRLLMRRRAIKPLLNNNFAGAVHAARKEWASFPGAGYGQRERRLQSLESVYNRSLAVGGANVSQTNPLPVMLSGGFGAGAGVSGGGGGGGGVGFGASAGVRGGSFNPATAPAVIAQAQQKLTQTYKDTVPVVTDVVNAQGAYVTTTSDGLASMRFFIHEQQAVPGVLEDATRATYAFSQSQEAYRRAAIKSADTIENIAGALGQVSGLLPGGGGQVGKKRGFFSKVLGFAAPFLSFIPGAGPLLSTLAGIGSNALAGNWAGVVSGVAGGLQSGGAFRSRGSSNGATLGDVTTGKVDGGQRAAGGPIRRGRAYLVGEHRPEIVQFGDDGYVHPSVEAYAGAQGRGAGGMQAGHWDRLLGVLERYEAMSPEHVLVNGAQTARGRGAIGSSFMRHAEQDGRVTEWMNRRVH